MQADPPSKSVVGESQLTLDFDLPPHFGRDDFLASPANAAALQIIETWPDWSDPLLLLLGPAGAGKSHLASIFAARSGAEMIAGSDLCGADLFALAEKPALVIDDAEAIGGAEAALFHLINLMRERRASLMLTARQQPAFWGLATADLLSRLRQVPAVELGSPDDTLLNAVLVKLFCDRQLIVDEAVIGYIALNIDRSLDLARRVVAQLDRAALARGGKVTRSMARALLQGFNAEEEREERDLE